MYDSKPLITRRPSTGEYSTVLIDRGDSYTIETVWFPKEGASQVIGHTTISKRAEAAKHIAAWEAIDRGESDA